MDRLTLLTLLRSLTRHRLYAALNIGGLAVGVAVFLVLMLYVRFETGYERWIPGHGRLYLVEAKLNGTIGDRWSENTPAALWSAASRDLPDTAGTRYMPRRATVLRDGVGTTVDYAQVDPTFPRLFDLPVARGDYAHAFDDPSSLVLSQEVATRYFGDADPIGRPLTLAFDGRKRVFRVAAVLAPLPRNTQLEIGMLSRIVLPENKDDPLFKNMHQWNYLDSWTFVRLPDADAVRRYSDELQQLGLRHARNETPDDPTVTIRTKPTPIAALHLDVPGRRLAVTTLGLVGLLTLLIAIVNYVNLATARAGLRAREVAMRKVLGADRRALATLYLGEACATAALAAFAGLALAEVGLPLVNAAAGLSLAIRYLGADGVLLPLAALAIVVGLLAGFYPALMLSRFPAAAVLASARSPGGGRAGARVREALVVAQFAIAIAFVIGTLVLVAQTAHVRAADVGYDRQGLLLVPSLGNANLTNGQRDTILHRLERLPGVSAATAANNAPGPGSFTAETGVAIPGVPGSGPNVRFFETTPGFFGVVGAHLLAGRLLDLSHGGDVNPNLDDPKGDGMKPYNVVINRTAVTTLHLGSPEAAVGRTVGGGAGPLRTVVGVVEDMRFDDPRTPIPPTLYDFQPRDPEMAIALLRFTGDPKAVLDAARAAWRQDAPEVPFDGRTAIQSLDKLYAQDDHSAHLFTIGAVLAVLIGCVGLWGLASFNTARRVREIGIRKTLGASSGEIVRLLVGQFLRPVVLANLFAWPLAFLAMRTWLAGFDDRIALSPLFFVAASLLALGVAVLTVVAQSLRAARATPAWALRHE